MRATLSGMTDDHVISSKVIHLAVLVALLLGVGLYNVVPLSSDGDDAPADASVAEGGDEAAAAPPAASAATIVESVLGGTFGSGVAALEQGLDAGTVVDAGAGASTLPRAPRTPIPPPVPAPTCPTDTANDAYESVSGPVSDAVGQQLPEDNLRVLAEIAAGCSAEPATTPVIGLALDLARLIPPTGADPVDLSAIPAVEAPGLPAAVIDALGPLRAPIQEGCGGVGLLGVLMAVVPGAANVPVHGQDLADVLVPAQSLCAQLEG